VGALAALVLVPLVGESIKGARCWIEIGGFSLQPSEFLKPALVLVSAGLFAQAQENANPKLLLAAVAVFIIPLALLVVQPDYGQSLLLILIWGSLFFIAGMPWLWLAGLTGAAVAGLGAAYMLVPHVGKRIDRFIDPDSGDNYQIGHALRSFLEGGWFGRGPGEGQVKHNLPDAHADFIFAVLGEEFGILVCLMVLALFAVIVLRGLVHAFRDRDMFRKLALAGLMLSTGFQVAINMGVNTGILPAKGMTLPLISYGGSSLLAMAMTLGLALGLSRRHRGDKRYERELALFRKNG
jgi:cell division protein FtsW